MASGLLAWPSSSDFARYLIAANRASVQQGSDVGALQIFPDVIGNKWQSLALLLRLEDTGHKH